MINENIEKLLKENGESNTTEKWSRYDSMRDKSKKNPNNKAMKAFSDAIDFLEKYKNENR